MQDIAKAIRKEFTSSNPLPTGNDVSGLIQANYISQISSGDLTLIPARIGQLIRVYSIIFKLKGTSENIIIVKDNATIIDQHILITKGDQSGFMTNFPIYRLNINSPLILNFSSTSEVIVSNILYEYKV